MTIRPIQLSEDQWEILEWHPSAGTFPLPFGMTVKTTTKDQANNSLMMVAEQLGSLGYYVEVEQAE